MKNVYYMLTTVFIILLTFFFFDFNLYLDIDLRDIEFGKH